MRDHLARNGWKGTRFWLSVFAQVMATVFVLTNDMTSEEWIVATKWILGLYGGSEVSTKGAIAVKQAIVERNYNKEKMKNGN